MPDTDDRHENGRFKDGHSQPGPGRPPAPKLVDSIREQWNEPPTELENKMAAEGLGIDPAEVPVFETVYELQVWVFRMKGLKGSENHFRELGDRAAPKPSRLAGLNRNPNSRAVAGSGGATDQEADLWFANLDGEKTDAGEDEDAELL